MLIKAESVSGVRVSDRLITVLIAASLGFFLIYGVGFVQSDILHNAAHDARHANGFPCH